MESKASETSKPSVILKLYAETRKRTFTYLVKSLIFHLLCTFKCKGKNVAETLPFIENISRKIKEMLLLAPIFVQTCQQIFLLYPRNFDTDGYLLESLKSTISVETNVPYKITNFSSRQI